MADAVVSSPPSLGELEAVLEARKTRLVENFRKPRAELLQKLALTFQDLMLPPDLSDLVRFQRVTLAALTEISDGLRDLEGMEQGYSRSLVQADREAGEAKTAYERADPLTQALDKHRHLQAYLWKAMEKEVYTEALSAIRQGKESAERSLHAARQRLSPTIREYLHARKSLLIEEAERNIEQARGQLRQAEGMRQRAEQVTAEFVVRYGFDPSAQEGV